MKRRILTISLVVAALVLLVTVGFAGWVITQSTTGSKEGNIEAYAVSNDGNLIIKIGTWSGSAFAEQSESIKFGHPSTMNANPEWLSFGSASASDVEDLDAWLEITWDPGTTTGNKSFTLTDTYKNSSDVEQNKTNVLKLIATPQFFEEDDDSNVLTVSGNVLTFSGAGTVVVKVHYGWAAVFVGGDSARYNSNPYTYFNSKNANDNIVTADVTNATSAGLQYNSGNFTTSQTYAQLAQAALSALDTLCSDLKFVITMAPSA